MHPARPRRADARERRRRVELRAVLHAGDQPVPQARRPHPRRRGRARVPRRARPHAAAGLRGLRGDRRRRARHRRPTASSSSCRSTRRPAPTASRSQQRPTSRRAASRACSSDAASAAGPRSSYIGTEVFLSLVDPQQAPYRARPAPARRCRRCAPTATWRCRCRSASAQTDFTLDVAAPVDGDPRR